MYCIRHNVAVLRIFSQYQSFQSKLKKAFLTENYANIKLICVSYVSVAVLIKAGSDLCHLLISRVLLCGSGAISLFMKKTNILVHLRLWEGAAKLGHF